MAATCRRRVLSQSLWRGYVRVRNARVAEPDSFAAAEAAEVCVSASPGYKRGRVFTTGGAGSSGWLDDVLIWYGYPVWGAGVTDDSAAFPAMMLPDKEAELSMTYGAIRDFGVRLPPGQRDCWKTGDSRSRRRRRGRCSRALCRSRHCCAGSDRSRVRWGRISIGIVVTPPPKICGATLTSSGRARFTRPLQRNWPNRSLAEHYRVRKCTTHLRCLA